MKDGIIKSLREVIVETMSSVQDSTPRIEEFFDKSYIFNNENPGKDMSDISFAGDCFSDRSVLMDDQSGVLNDLKSRIERNHFSRSRRDSVSDGRPERGFSQEDSKDFDFMEYPDHVSKEADKSGTGDSVTQRSDDARVKDGGNDDLNVDAVFDQAIRSINKGFFMLKEVVDQNSARSVIGSDDFHKEVQKIVRDEIRRFFKSL